MSAVPIEPEPVPLVRDESGRLMVPGTRISLDVLVAAFRRGKTPEAIQVAYPSVALADVYAIFTYFLRHRREVELYLAEQEDEASVVRARTEAEYPVAEVLRAKLLTELDT